MVINSRKIFNFLKVNHDIVFFYFFFSFFAGVDVHDSGVCAGKDCIFVAGGRQRGKDACRLDLDTFKWMDLPEMSVGRRSPGKEDSRK